MSTAVMTNIEVERLAVSLDPFSPLSIQTFGSNIAARTASYTDKLLQRANTSDIDDTGDQLAQIVSTARRFDLSTLDRRHARLPIIGALWKSFVDTRDRALARFESVKDQVEELVARVENTAKELAERSSDHQAMYDGVRSDHDALTTHVEAITLRLAQVDAELISMPISNDLDGAERRAVLEAGRQALSKRRDDLEVLRTSAMQMLPMIRVVQANNLTLIDKFQAIQTLTLPAWKRSFVLALALDEQKTVTELANSIDDTTNAIMRRNAELLHQNAVATARANQRLVVDVATLKHTHDSIIRTLEDVKRVHEEGARERGNALVELDRLRKDMLGLSHTKALNNAA